MGVQLSPMTSDAASADKCAAARGAVAAASWRYFSIYRTARAESD